MLSTSATELATFGSLAFGAVLFVAQAAALAGGRWWGTRRANAANTSEGSGVLIGGMLGLLGFVLALTLSHAGARFEERRQGALAEANAIGTAWLRAHAIAHPKGIEIAAQLEDYAKLRLSFVQAGTDIGPIMEIHRRTGALQSDIWRNLSAITQERSDPIAAQLMVALNETFDRSTAERFAFALAIPPQILWLITVLPLAAMAALGFHLGLRGDAQRMLPIVLIAMLTSVSTLILDLGSPRLGNIRPSAAAYEWTISGFAGPPPAALRPTGR